MLFNPAVARGYLNLSATDRLMALVNERLSSGTRINRATDDPTGMSLANVLRHHFTGVMQATDNAEQGVTLLQTAEGAMDESANILVKLRQLLVSAANTGTQDDAQLQALQNEFNAGIQALDRIADTSRFGSQRLLRGDFASNTLSTAATKYYQDVTFDATKLPGGVVADSTLSIGAPSADLTREKITVTLGTAAGVAAAPFPESTTLLSGLYQDGTQLSIVGSTTLSLTGPLGAANITVSPANTVGDLVGLVNANTETTGLRAFYDDSTGELSVESTTFGNGVMSITGSDLTGGSFVGLLDGDTTDPYEGSNDVFAMAFGAAIASDPILGLTDVASTVTFNEVDGKNFSLYGKGTSASLTLTDTTTIQDVVDFVNANTEKTGALATFTGGSLIITGIAGSMMVSSDELTSAASGVGLLDRTTGTLDSAGAAHTATAANETLDFTFTDAGGTARTVKLTQDPLSDDGLTFINLTPGPELAPPYSGWEAGAIRVTLKDNSGGEMFSTQTVTTDPQTALRRSSKSFQTGGGSGDSADFEIRDMHAAALGLTAFQEELASTALVKPLVTKGYHSLLDLMNHEVVKNGDASQALRLIDAAIDEVSQTRAKIGSAQRYRVEAALNTLRVTSENLVSAESVIRDTDFALESSEFSRLNILMQSATAMLAQANQTPQRVLQMLSGR
jgi:flagellin